MPGCSHYDRRSTGKLLTGDAIPASVHRCTLARPFFALKIRAPIGGGLMNSGVTRAHWSISGRPPRNASFSLNESVQCSSHSSVRSPASEFRISKPAGTRLSPTNKPRRRDWKRLTSLQRISTLYNRGIQTQTSYDEIVREQKVASAVLTALERRLQATEIELTAARQGIFVTDGFNDIPRSAQRASELGQLIAEMQATIVEQDRRLASLQSQIQEEADRYGVMSVAVMTSPTDGQIWENLTSPGEDIRRGQDLMRMLDCKATVVTAAVSEANFNKLKIGSKATFRLRGEAEEFSGRVVGLHGLASTPANLAINQSTLAREPYHATIEVPALTTGDSCQVGRTGVVTFDTTVAAQRTP